MTVRSLLSSPLRRIDAGSDSWHWSMLFALPAAPLCGWFITIGRYEYALATAAALPLAIIVIRWPFAGLLLWVALIQFVVTRDSAEVSTTQWVLHRIGMPGLLGLLAGYHLTGWRRSSFRLEWYDVALAGFVLLGLFNVLAFSPNVFRGVASFHDKLLVPILIFWLIRALSPTRRDMDRLIAVGLFVVGVQVTIGLLSWAAPEILPGHWLGRAGARTTGTLGGPAPFTVTIVFFGMLMLDRMLAMRPSLSKLALWALLGAGVLVIFLSLSRGSWLGAAAVVAGLVLAYRRTVLWPGLVALAVAAILLLGPLSEQAELAEARAGTTSTVESRIITNVAAVQMIADRPVFGFGFARFEDFDEQYKARVGDLPLEVGGSAHNTYLNLAAEMGLPAFALYFAPVGGLAWLSIRRRNLIPDHGPFGRRTLYFLWLALLDQFLVCNFMEMVQSSAWATSIWWLTLGLIAVVINRQRNARIEPPARGPSL